MPTENCACDHLEFEGTKIDYNHLQSNDTYIYLPSRHLIDRRDTVSFTAIMPGVTVRDVDVSFSRIPTRSLHIHTHNSAKKYMAFYNNQQRKDKNKREIRAES